jgi:multiple sugar transport system permease protein
MASTSTSISTTRVRRRWGGLNRREWIDGWLFFSPWLLGFLAFTFIPMGYSIYLIFLHWNLITPPTPAGLDNIKALFQDPLVPLSLYDTAFYTILGVPLQLTVALLLALALNAGLRGTRAFRTIFYIPSIVPAVAMAVVWVEVLNPVYGLLNTVLEWLHLPGQSWLLFPTSARFAFVFISLWQVGGQMVIFLAGLQGVPETLLDAAAVDGATKWQRFWRITLPMLSSTLFFNLVIGIIASFQVFTQAYVMTNGGPENATLFFVLYIYAMGFQSFQMGYAATLAWLLFGIIGLFTLVQFRLAGRWVFYEV